MAARSRSFLIGITLALILGACSITSKQPSSEPGATGNVPATPRTPGSTTTTAARPGSTAPGSTAQTQPGPGQSAYQDLGQIGAMARAYLRSSPATSLVVEIDWVAGRAPSSEAVDHLAAILRRETNKPSGVTISGGSEIGGAKETWTLDDLVALERSARSRRSGGSRATMWIAYVGGSFAKDDGALGVAFAASAAVIFRDRIGDASSVLLPASRIERSVLVHEVGHLLALVNIGYRSRFDHEDPEHEHHSNNRDSVMFWAVEDVLIRDLLGGGPPDDFDSADRADLAMLRQS